MISIRCIGGFCMNQITERIEELKEIHVNKMNFRVVSRHPEYAKNVKSQISRSMRKDLYTVFKKYT